MFCYDCLPQIHLPLHILMQHNITAQCVVPVQARSDSSEWQDKWQHAVKELADVKERAWTLLEEKDVQLQALKVTHVTLKQAYSRHPGRSLVQRLLSCHCMALSWLVMYSCIVLTFSAAQLLLLFRQPAVSRWCLSSCSCIPSIICFSLQHGNLSLRCSPPPSSSTPNPSLSQRKPLVNRELLCSDPSCCVSFLFPYTALAPSLAVYTPTHSLLTPATPHYGVPC